MNINRVLLHSNCCLINNIRIITISLCKDDLELSRNTTVLRLFAWLRAEVFSCL